MPKGNERIYAVYQGDTFICLGTAKECAKFMDLTPASVRFLGSPTYHKRLKKFKNPDDCRIAIIVK